tara:strand:- start:1970 stop:2167 length:198 start_codon:yes stop_codon:yes gene_type:complete
MKEELKKLKAHVQQEVGKLQAGQEQLLDRMASVLAAVEKFAGAGSTHSLGLTVGRACQQGGELLD